MVAKGYTTEELVEAELGNDITISTTPTTAQVAMWIEEAEAEIDERTQSSFTSASVTDAIVPYDEHSTFRSSFTNYGYSLRTDHNWTGTTDFVYLYDENGKKIAPILTITSLYRNKAGSNTQSDDWELLTENTGSGGDFFLDKLTGAITFTQNKPTFGLNRGIKWSGTYGHSTVPKDVQKLATKLVARRVLQMKAKSSQFSSIDSISLESISISKNISQTVMFIQSLESEIEVLFDRIIGAFASDLVV